MRLKDYLPPSPSLPFYGKSIDYKNDKPNLTELRNSQAYINMKTKSIPFQKDFKLKDNSTDFFITPPESFCWAEAEIDFFYFDNF